MAEPRTDHGTLTAADDLDLFYRSWTVPDAKGLLVIAHGLGEHGGRYRHVVEAVAPAGFSVYALDHRGHGRSGGRRGHVMRFAEWVQDLRSFVELARNRETGKKTFLLGHSLGGLIALTYALAHPETLDGLVVSSPALGLYAPVPRIKEAIGRRLSDLWPTLTLGNGIDARWISRDSREVEAYKNDPLVHDRVSARMFTEFTGQMEQTGAAAKDLRLPCLFQIAGDDHLVDAEASRRFFERVGSPDKTLRWYDGFYHEVYNDLQREVPLGDLVTWLSAHLTAPGDQTQA